MNLSPEALRALAALVSPASTVTVPMALVDGVAEIRRALAEELNAMSPPAA